MGINNQLYAWFVLDRRTRAFLYMYIYLFVVQIIHTSCKYPMENFYSYVYLANAGLTQTECDWRKEVCSCQSQCEKKIVLEVVRL